MWNHFNYREFDSPDAPGSGVKMDREFMDMLDAARSIAGVRMIVNSGFRTPKHNKAIGGTPNSSHLRGLAADIACRNSTTRFRIVAALIAAGFTRIGIADTFIHVDNDPVKTPAVVWLYA
jgi:uncharacterized protein YcbK (DUF882 family)